MALIEDQRQQWLAVGMSTERANIAGMQRAWSALYRRANRRPVFTWVTPGPIAALCAMLVWKKGGLGASLRASLGDSLDASLDASLRASLDASLGDSLDASLRASLRASLDASLDASLRASLDASLDASLGDSLDAQTWSDYRWTWFWGAHDAYWVGWYRCAQALGVPFDATQDKRLGELEALCRNGLWSWVFENGVIACDRPIVCKMEERAPGRWVLHCDDGPALAFRDGYAVYAVHGVRVPGRVIMAPETITAGEITAESNAEVRRVMLPRFGEGRYIEALGAKALDRSDYGTLYRAELEGDEPLVMVKVTNATPEPDGSFKDYWLRCHPELRPIKNGQVVGEPQAMRARNAVAASFGRRGEDYAPVEQT